ncbi:MAG: ISNCY family transposase [Desulfobacterales bacterium]|nr:ISNCY family transposase [Desulfobacterales bacterium]
MLLRMKEVNRLRVIQGYMDGKIGIEEAARILKCTARSVYRMVAKVREKGPEGVLHGNRDRASPRRVPESVRKKLVEWAQGKYRDINDTHLCEILSKTEGITMGRETLRSILRKGGIPSKRKVKRRRYRSRRERKEAFGMMLQVDASPHDWLEGRGPWLTLVGGKDDATGFVWAHFEEAETTWGYLDLMQEVFNTHGVPLSLYSDRHSIFHTTREPTIIEQLKDIVPLTQFGRAMDELGISLIKAWTPQAKGRIERQWGTFQDRLVVGLRLAGATTLEQAREVLKSFLKEYNQRFCVLPKQAAAVFRKAPPKAVLHKILCLKETRTVKKDHTVSFEGLVLQIPFSKKYPCMADGRVDVRQYRDGHIEIVYRDCVVARFSSEAITRLLNTRSVQRNIRMAA